MGNLWPFGSGTQQLVWSQLIGWYMDTKHRVFPPLIKFTWILVDFDTIKLKSVYQTFITQL